VPALLQELRQLIPHFGASFFFVDERGVPVNLYDENPETSAVASLYFDEFYDRREREIGYSFSESLRSRTTVQGPEHLIRVEAAIYRRSDFFNLIFRPLGYDGVLRLVVRDSDQIRGALNLHRAPGERPFEKAERDRLATLAPFFGHAMVRGRDGWSLVGAERSGMIVADMAGRCLHASPEARRLLFLATHPVIAPSVAVERSLVLPPALQRICRSLGVSSPERMPRRPRSCTTATCGAASFFGPIGSRRRIRAQR
jgi:hypothetical protein